MPNITSITINDGTADVTFNPDTVTPSKVVLVEANANIAHSMKRRIEFDRPSQKGAYRRTARLVIPYTDEAGNIRYQNYSFSTVGALDSSESERTAMTTLATNVVNNGAITDMINKSGWFW